MAVRTVLRGPRNAHWLLNEHFWWFASVLSTVVLPRRVAVWVSLYAPNRLESDPMARSA